MQETPIQLLGWEDPLEKGIGYPLQYSWVSLMAQPVKNPPEIWETWVRSLDWEDSLEKGKASHSTILAWIIPGSVQSMGLKRVRQDWKTFTFILIVGLLGGSYWVISNNFCLQNIVIMCQYLLRICNQKSNFSYSAWQTFCLNYLDYCCCHKFSAFMVGSRIISYLKYKYKHLFSFQSPPLDHLQFSFFLWLHCT